MLLKRSSKSGASFHDINGNSLKKKTKLYGFELKKKNI